MSRHQLCGFVGVCLVVVLGGAGLYAEVHTTALVDAISKGDHQALRAQLRAGANVNAPLGDGSTALHWAAERGDQVAVDLLLQAGASAKATSRYGVAPLSLAALNGHAGMLTSLIKAGADPNSALPEGETVLMTAARTGNVDAVRVLLAHGARVDARDELRGQTALMWAAAQNNAGVIRTLVEAGADVRARTSNASAGDMRMSESGNTFGAPAPTRFTALLFGVRAGSLDAVRALLEAGADVNDELSDGENALVVAAANAHWDVADLLLDRGASPNAAKAGWNALHQAVRTRRMNIGFGTPGPIPTGTTDSVDVIRKMIAKGANVNARMTRNGMKDGQRNRLNRLGATPFFLAAKVTDTEVMKILVQAGAKPSLPAADGTTPLMVAAGLQQWNPGEDGGSLPGQEPEVLEAVKICVDLGNDVNARNDQGETALHGAAYRGVNSIVEYLASKGATLDAKDQNGWTPLAVANGLSYTDFYKEQVHTAALLRDLLQAKGLPTDGQRVDSKVCFGCLQTRGDQARAVVDRDLKMEADFAAGKYDHQTR
ncbi:MAG: ankyrin repeat domain-containing protein [Vicinamibacterales bacterium]